MKINPIVTKISAITGLALGAFALSVFASNVAGWNPPSATPPNGNVDAPISVGGGTTGNIYSQTKTGFLTLANFIFNPTLTQGSVTAGSVLTATDNNGTVGWKNVQIRSGTTPGSLNILRSVTFSSPMPTTNYAVTANIVTAGVPSRAGETIWITNKTLTGFSFKVGQGFNSDYNGNGDVDWIATTYQ